MARSRSSPALRAGIGLETARALHNEGASVVIVDLDAGDAERAAQAIGARAIGVGADVTDLEAMRLAVEHTVDAVRRPRPGGRERRHRARWARSARPTRRCSTA